MRISRPPAFFRENVALAPFTSLGVGGPARFMAEVTTEGQALETLEFGDQNGLPVFILGGGSNLLVADAGFPGLVIRVSLRGITQTGGGLLVAAAGEEWDQFVSRSVGQGLAGIECLSGIPGTVGGTPVQNVGAYGQDVSATITSLRALDRTSRQVVELTNEQCGFGYRTSVFNTTERERYIVLSVSFALQPGGAPRITYPDLQRSFAGRAGRPTLAEVRTEIVRIRESKSMILRPGDPDARSAGSFFKNPIVPSDRIGLMEDAARRHGRMLENEAMPRHAITGGMAKLPAAWLIEHAGFAKGYVRGRAGLSSKHALALINRGGATAQELLDLMREIQSAVRQLFGIELIPEPVFVGFQ
jgi:UDP-N-acetylmuramate dehydrogenase